MYYIENSRHFTPYTDPVSGVKSYILTTRVAALQQGFYFVNSGFSDDGRYLWFYCANPPAPHYVAMLDLETDTISEFPDATGSGWCVDGPTGDMYWGCPDGLRMHHPVAGSESILVGAMPEEARRLGARYLGTNLTFTPDKTEMVVDVQIKNPDGSSGGSRIGTMTLADGEFHEWYRTEPGIPYNHAQCSPIDPDLCMCAHEFHYDPVLKKNVPPSKTPEGIYPRLQLIRRDGTRQMMIPHANSATHECWSADGKSFYYCSGTSAEEGEIRGQHVIARDWMDGKPAEVVAYLPVEGGVGAWHAHSSIDGRYFVVDGSYNAYGLSWWRGTRSFTRFYDTKTKEVKFIISDNPIVNGYTPDNPCAHHIDPHPRFCCGDRYVVHTTTVLGRVDVAVTPVAGNLID